MRPKTNPFQINPILDPESFIGREKVVKGISSAMANLANVSVIAERRTGATSLLRYLAHQDTSSRTGLPSSHIPVYLDFQSFSTQASLSDIWYTIVKAIAREVKHRDSVYQDRITEILTIENESPADESLALAPLARMLNLLGNLGLKVNLLFDEFDQTACSPKLGSSFYNALRSLPIRVRNTSYVITTRTGLAALQLGTEPYNKISSPFFNIFLRLCLRPFTDNSVRDLIFNYFSRANASFDLAEKLAGQRTFLYDMTGYHPLFLQILCYRLFDRLDYPDWPLGKAKEEAALDFRRDATPHFEYYWNVSSDEERHLLERLAKQQFSSEVADRKSLCSLEDRCLVVADKNAERGYRLFSSVFNDWCLNQKVQASSSVPSDVPRPFQKSDSPAGIRILFLAANPTDTTPLRLDAEMRAIDLALQQTAFRDRFEIKQHWAVRVADLQYYLLRHQPDIVHFSGHGSVSSEIILEDTSGSSHPVSARSLSRLFSVLKDNIRCVVLNACYSEPQAQAIARSIDCVVGMSKAIGDKAAIEFAATFYQALGFGRDVRTAFDLGCVQIDLEGLDEQDTPKLLTKSKSEDVLFIDQLQ